MRAVVLCGALLAFGGCKDPPGARPAAQAVGDECEPRPPCECDGVPMPAGDAACGPACADLCNQMPSGE